MHLLPVILLSLLIDCVQAHLKSADIQTPKPKAHQTVFEFSSSEADRSAANILADNQCDDPSTSDARGSGDVCELSRYKPHDNHPTRETSSLSYASHPNAKNDDQKYLTKIIPDLVDTKEESAENPPAEDHIALDIQETQFSKNTSETSQPIQARSIATRPRTRPVKHGWRNRSKFRAWIPRRKAPSRLPPKTWLPSKGKAPARTSPTRQAETARRFRTPKRTRDKSVFLRPKRVIRKKQGLRSTRNRPNRSLGLQGRKKKSQKTTDSRRVFKPTNLTSTRRKNKHRKKHRATKANMNVPAPSKPAQGASSLPQIFPPVAPQPNWISGNPTSTNDPPNSPPIQNHVATPPQLDAIPTNPSSSNTSPNAPMPSLNQESPTLSQTAPLVPPQPNRAQGSSDENVVQDPSASILNNHTPSHIEQENVLPSVTSLDSSHDLEIHQSESRQQVGRFQTGRRPKASRSRPSRSRAIQNHRSAPYQSPSQDDDGEIMEEANLEEAEEFDQITREMPSRRAHSSGQSPMMHMSDLLFSTINSALPHLLGNSEIRRTRNPEMEDMPNGMMEENDFSREARGPPTDEFLHPNQGQPDLDAYKTPEESMDIRPQSASRLRPQSASRSRPLNLPSHDVEQENNEEDPYELALDPRPRRASEHRGNPTEPHSSRLAKSKPPNVRAQETENITDMRASNKANEESGSKIDEKFAKHPHDDDDDDDDDDHHNLENIYDEEDDDNSEDSSQIDSQADLEPHHNTRTQLNSNSDRESKHKAVSEPHHKLLNETQIEEASNSTNKINATTNLEVHPDMSTDTDHEHNDKPSVDVHTGINPIANNETNYNSSTGGQSENDHNASHEANLEDISDNKLIDKSVNHANNTKGSLSGADGIDIEEVSNST